MTVATKQRNEQRLYVDWPIWFAEDYGKTFYCGRILAISSRAVSLSCYLTKKSLPTGKQITVYFKVPHLDIANLTQIGHILRIDTIDGDLRRIIILFDEPLPFKPGELELLKSSFATSV
jgi:hypothetical protein